MSLRFSKGIVVAREVGERYACDKCGAQLVYEKPCPCPNTSPHSEICCGEQMKRVERAGEDQADQAQPAA